MSHLDKRRTQLDLPLCGIIPPLVTPLTTEGKLDVDAHSVLIERVIGGSVHGLFLLGSTGEFCSLSGEVRKQVVTETCRITAGRVPIIVNVSDTAIEESLRLATHAAKAGAAGVAICPPYYLPVMQNDLIRYARKFAGAADVPVFLYNIPQYAHLEFEVETVLRLSEVPNIVGLKNSSGRIDYIAGVSCVKVYRPEFSLLVGTEEIMLDAIEAGADGSVCGGANMFPALYMRLFEAIRSHRRSEALELQDLIARIAKAVYSVGPAATSYYRGIKCALAFLGVCGESLAEPLTAFGPDDKEELHLRLSRLLPEIDKWR